LVIAKQKPSYVRAGSNLKNSGLVFGEETIHKTNLSKNLAKEWFKSY
jgi:hypothetical protein